MVVLANYRLHPEFHYPVFMQDAAAVVRWVVDHTDRIRQLAKQVIRKIYTEAEAVSDLSKRQAIAKHAMSSESDKRIRAMISLAESELPITPEELDIREVIDDTVDAIIEKVLGKGGKVIFLGSGSLTKLRRIALVTAD
mgnify:CR=1 FL=1